jgi:N utilization substance protein A
VGNPLLQSLIVSGECTEIIINENEFMLAFNSSYEKGLPRNVVLEASKQPWFRLPAGCNASNAQLVEAKINPETGEVTVFAEKEVVDSVQDERTEVTLEDAQKIDPATELGGMVVVECTPKNFGRVAAQTARQVIQQRIREAERDSQEILCQTSWRNC